MDVEEIQHCGDCKHWHRSPSNIVDLSQIRGQCRESPPTASPICVAQGNQVNIVAWVSEYPLLPPNQPACSRFEDRFVEIVPWLPVVEKNTLEEAEREETNTGES